MSDHIRSRLRAIVSVHCSGTEGLYEQFVRHGLKLHYADDPIESDDPVDHAARFLCDLMTEDGKFNGFAEPAALVPRFLQDFGIRCDAERFFLRLRANFAEDRTTFEDFIETVNMARTD